MLWYSTKFNGCPVNVLFQPMAGHKFQAMDCLMFQNQKPLSDSPFELFWTAKNIDIYVFQKLDHCRPQPSIQLERGHSG